MRFQITKIVCSIKVTFRPERSLDSKNPQGTGEWVLVPLVALTGTVAVSPERAKLVDSTTSEHFKDETPPLHILIGRRSLC